MDLTAQLARFNLDPALAEFLTHTLEQAQDSARQVAQRDVQIQQLTTQAQR